MQSPFVARPRALVLLAVLVAGLVLLLASAVRAGNRSAPLSEWRVAPGETLWSIAGHLAGAEGDLRAVEYEIRKLNDVSPSGLRAGHVLLVPGG